jgi:hypothetical protein
LLLLTSLPGEPSGAVTLEVMHQVCTVASEQAGLLQTVVNILLAMSSHPAFGTLAGVPALWECSAHGSVTTGVAILRAGVLCHVTVLPFETVSAQALEVVRSGQVLAHSSVWTRPLHTVRDLILALQPSESLGTLALVALRKVHTGGSIEARPRSTLINIYFTVLASKPSGAVALGSVMNWHAQPTMFAEVVIAHHRLAIILTRCSCAHCLLARLAFEALPLPSQRLEMVCWAGSAWGQASVAVVAGRALLTTLGGVICTRLEGEHSFGAVFTCFEPVLWRLQCEAIP